jgi:hypothetical protein
LPAAFALLEAACEALDEVDDLEVVDLFVVPEAALLCVCLFVVALLFVDCVLFELLAVDELPAED